MDRDLAPLTLRLCGAWEARVSDAPLPALRSRKERWLLALLALHAPRPVAREWLAQTLWPFPETLETRAALNLRRSLWNLRAALGTAADRLTSPEPHRLALDLRGCDVDVWRLREALQQGDEAKLAAAVALYRGPLLPEVTEDWVAPEREAVRLEFLQACDRLVDLANRRHDGAAVVTTLRRALAQEPRWEHGVRRLMECLAEADEFQQAQAVYRQYHQQLTRDDPRARPGPATARLYETLKFRQNGQQMQGSATPREFRPQSLPCPLTPLIGREAEGARIRERLSKHRLVTLTGVGGIGKTRLAIEVARTLENDFADGVAWVDLSGLMDPNLVDATVATALGISESTQQATRKTLTQHLSHRSLLLVLDNCEHLLSACSPLANDLLGAIPGLKILATSRHPLEIPGEAIWRVASLGVPDTQSVAYGAEAGALAIRLGQYPAIQLFVARAEAACPGFALTAMNAAYIDDICRRLDGLPLAIELAAARVASLAPEQIAAYLSPRLLAVSGEGLSARHRTLSSPVEWSWGLLQERERRLLRSLAVFRGGWTLAAAEAVSGDGEARHSGTAVLDVHTALVSHSLILSEHHDGVNRYRMLEPVREYVQDKLVESGEEPKARGRHWNYYLECVAAANGEHNQGLNDWKNWLLQEEDNLVAATEWCREDPERILSLVIPLVEFVRVNFPGSVRLKADWARALHISVAAASGMKSVAAFPVIHLAAHHAFKRCDYAAADNYYAQLILLGERIGDRIIMAHGLRGRGMVRWCRSDYAGADECFTEALQIAEMFHDWNLIAGCCQWLGQVAMDYGDYAAAEAHLERALRVQHAEVYYPTKPDVLNALGNLRLREANYADAHSYFEQAFEGFHAYHMLNDQALSLNGMGMVAARTRQLDRGEGLLLRARAIHHDTGDAQEEAISLAELGRIAMLRGHPEAEPLLREALTIRARLGLLREALESLEAFAVLASQTPDWERCVVLLTATAALRETLQFPVHRHMEIDFDGMLRTACSAMGTSPFRRAQQAGTAMDLKHAVDYALTAC